MRVLEGSDREAVGLDVLESPFTTHVGSIADATFVHECMQGIDFVLHTATLHKPHVATHTKQAFIDTNISGTLNILEAAVANQVSGVVFTSTTSAFGAALSPADGQPAAWITEEVTPIPKNIYGVTKIAAENLCELFYRTQQLPCIVLRTSRFFPERDDNPKRRSEFHDRNLKVNEFLHRRVDIADAAEAHLQAIERLTDLGFGRYIISATTPFTRNDLQNLRTDAAQVVRERFPDYDDVYSARGWNMYSAIDRVYVNQKAVEELGWEPRFDFRYVLDRLHKKQSPFSDLTWQVGSKGYHSQVFEDGPYPVDKTS